MLRAGHAFDFAADSDPDPEVILNAIARSLGIAGAGRAPRRTDAPGR